MLTFVIAMKISIREWRRDDLPAIQSAWLDFCREGARSDMRLKPDAGPALMAWLTSRFRENTTLGFIGETSNAWAGFLIGRVGQWESVPPVVEPRKLGIIDAVYVDEPFRRQGIGRRLIERAVEAMRERDAVAVETTYDSWSEASSEIWHRTGFAPWMVHVYRML